MLKLAYYNLKFSNSTMSISSAFAIFARVESFGSIVPHSTLLTVRVVSPVFSAKSSCDIFRFPRSNFIL